MSITEQWLKDNGFRWFDAGGATGNAYEPPIAELRITRRVELQLIPYALDDVWMAYLVTATSPAFSPDDHIGDVATVDELRQLMASLGKPTESEDTE